MKFHEPPRVEAVTRVGWDPRTDRFVFPRFQIAANGGVTPRESPIPAEDAPCGNLLPPSGDREIPALMLRLSELGSELARLYWAVFAAIATNILGPKYGLAPSGICLVGHGAQHVGHVVGRAMGCAEFAVNHPCDVEAALVWESSHGVPVVSKLRTSLVHRATREFFQGQGRPRNCLVGTDWQSAQILALSGGWHLIEGNDALVVPDDVLRLATLALPAFLDDTLSNANSNDESCPASPVGRTLWQVADFVRRRGGNPDEVYAATKHLRVDCEATSKESFLDLVGRLVSLRKISLGETAFKRRPRMIIVPERDQLVLPHSALVTVTRKLPVSLPSASLILARLEGQPIQSQTTDKYVLSRSQAFERWRNDSSLVALPPVVRSDPQYDGAPSDSDAPRRIRSTQSTNEGHVSSEPFDGATNLHAHSKQ